jgi:hypothetical protein
MNRVIKYSPDRCLEIGHRYRLLIKILFCYDFVIISYFLYKNLALFGDFFVERVILINDSGFEIVSIFTSKLNLQHIQEVNHSVKVLSLTERVLKNNRICFHK